MTSLVLFIGAFAFAAVVLQGQRASAAQIVVFGDSWGAAGKRPFEEMFARHGYEDVQVDNVAVGGTTAAYWARDPECIADAVAENPDCTHVWLSIGGNDGIYGLSLGKTIEEVIEQAVNDTVAIVDPVRSRFPNVRVVQFGYDIVNFETSIVCRRSGETIFRNYCDGGDTTCYNTMMYNLQYGVELVHERCPNQDVLDLLGSMQSSDSSIPPPYPNDAYSSPAELMRDCIHPNDDGFDIIFDAMWEAYWRAEMGRLNPKKHG